MIFRERGSLIRKITYLFWFAVAVSSVFLIGLLITRGKVFTDQALLVIGIVLIAAIILTALLQFSVSELRPQMGQFLLAAPLIFLTGVVFVFFPNQGAELPNFEGNITPKLTTLSLFFIIAVGGGWIGFLLIRESPALNSQAATKYFTGLSVAVPLIVLIFFIGYTVSEGSSVISWRFISQKSDLLRGTAGIFPAIMGTVWLIVGATVFAVPIGVGAAVFLTEYAKRKWIKQLVGITADCLWSTPSIVFGLFGYIFLVPRITGHSTLLAGQIILASMLLPLTIATSTEALMSVPDEFRSGSLALGSSKWWTIRTVVLPSAVPSVVTGVLLGIGRIAGETAPIMLIAVTLHASAPKFFSLEAPYVHVVPLFREIDALPYRLYSIYKAGVGGSLQEAWGTAMVLIALVLLFYGLGITVRSYFRRRRGW